MENIQENEQKTTVDMAIEKIGVYPFLTLLAIITGPWGFVLAGIVQSYKYCKRRAVSATAKTD